MSTPRTTPPRTLERLLERTLPEGLSGDGVLGDLAEDFERRATRSLLGARVWYLRQTVSLVLYHLLTGSGSDSRVDSDLLMDLRWSLRMMLKHPGFAFAVILVLGLGLGTNAAVFSVVDGTFENASWWAEPDRTIAVSPDQPFSFGHLELYREENTAYRTVGGYHELAFALRQPDGTSQSINGARISPDLFSELAVSPVRGRAFTEEDGYLGVEPVAVIGEDLWRRTFGGDPEVVGQTIDLSGGTYRVIGIQGAGGRAPGGLTEVWIPLIMDPRDDDYFREQNLTLIGVLNDGASLENAYEELAAYNVRLSSLFPMFYPEGFADSFQRVARADETQRQMVATPLLLLFVGTGLLLLVTALNVGNLLLGRGIERRKELAVRTAIGAGRGRIVGQLLVEGGVLSLFAIGLGLWSASLFAPVIADLFVGQAIVSATPILSLKVLGFAALAMTAAWVILSGIPILNFLGQRPDGLRGGPTRGTGLQKGLVSVQAGLATLLLVAATLLVQTVGNLRSVPLGFDASDVVAVELSPPEDRIANPVDARAFYQDMVSRVEAMAGVEAVGMTAWLPLRRPAPDAPLNLESDPVDVSMAPKAPLHRVDPGFFAAMGVEPIEGRVFTAGEAGDVPSAVVVNQALADLLFPGVSVVGQRIAIDPHAWDAFLPIVGVVPNLRSDGISEDAGPAAYAALGELPARDVTIVARASGDLEELGARIQTTVTGADALVPVRSIAPMSQVVQNAYAISWVVMGLLLVLAVLATGLGGIGIYAVLAQHVVTRRREMGVRMALGAEPGAVIQSVVRSGLFLALTGIAAGSGAAVFLTGLLESQLFGISNLAPSAYVARAVTLAIAATVAAWIPALRAGRLPPSEVLRAE